MRWLGEWLLAHLEEDEEGTQKREEGDSAMPGSDSAAHEIPVECYL